MLVEWAFTCSWNGRSRWCGTRSDEEGRGSSIQGNWKHGKRHGRFVERNCEGEVVGDYSYQDGDLTR